MTPENFQSQQQILPQYHSEEDTISLLDILLVLAKHIKLIIVTPIILCIITIINALFFTSPVYVSTATFMSSVGSSNQSQMMGLASQFGYPLPNTDSGAKWSYEEVIKSRTMAKALLKHRFTTEKYGVQKELLQILTYGDEEPGYGIDTLIIQGIESVSNMIEIEKTPTLYELKISTFEPQLATDIATGVMGELDRHQRAYNARKTTETRQFIEERLLETKTELEETEETLKAFRERNRSILESPKLQLEQGRLIRDVSVSTGVFMTLKQQLETAKIEEVKESDYVVILDQPEIPLYPAKSNKRLLVILAGILGIGLGMVLAFIKEYAINSDEEEKEKMGKVKSIFIKNIIDFLPKFLKKK